MAQRVKKSTPTARTSGSANGSSITGLSALVAIARAAATIVAVAPTLLAKSHVSLSVRGMRLLSKSEVGILSQYNDRGRIPSSGVAALTAICSARDCRGGRDPRRQNPTLGAISAVRV
ncbi:hypothetical protein MSAS_13730 [Mycobacterium saskatchewanense]|nr:hypothetical protein MSAS_13730 [Mycobacterium saskatchewanense]